MTQAGGPAALNGFLYQLLHHLGWLVEASFSGAIADQSADNALLVLEPRRGGDARAETIDRYLVEQYKTREDGTWSTSAVVEVLQDLRKAVPTSRPSKAVYRFVTDGRPGRLASFRSFLVDVRNVTVAADLDNHEARKFGNELILTNRQFFDRVVDLTRSNQTIAEDDEQATVLHLLAAFEMVFESSGDHQAMTVERLLRNYVPNLGDERGIRQRLIGYLMQRLSLGECRLTGDDIASMLQEVGLSPDRMKRLATLSDAMHKLVQRRSQHLRYHSEHDVRSAPAWPSDSHVLIITGESGTGKSWQLGRLLDELGQQDTPATLLTAGMRLDEILNQAASDVWQRGLIETSSQTIGGLANFLRELVPNAPWKLTIGVDDLQDIDLARALVRQDWEDWRMRLVITAPPSIAQALELSDGGSICVRRINEFSVDELSTLLASHDRSWTELPSDLKRLLRNPILAGLYLDLDHTSFKSAPGSEYEIFEAFWKRIAVRAHPGDEGIVVAFANWLLEGQSYPLPRSQWNEVGLHDDALHRLAAAGWLKSASVGDVTFAHDRLLNWAIAKALCRRFDHRVLGAAALAALLAHETINISNAVGRRLGYVAMDTLWILAEQPERAADIASIVRQMEQSSGSRTSRETLYAELIPTLGPRAVPILSELLNQPLNDGAKYRLRLLGTAFSAVAGQEGVDLGGVVDDALRHQSRDVQGLALRILTAVPALAQIDRVWAIHQLDVAVLEDRSATGAADRYFESMAALRAAAENWPGWLLQKIQLANAATESIPSLGYLLHGLQHSDAASIWSSASSALFVKMPDNKPRSLLICIARFKDAGRMAYVISQLTRSEDSAAGTALFALTILDPAIALQRLTDVPEWERDLHRNSWLPPLLRLRPEQTRARVLEMAQAAPRTARVIESLFGQRADDIDSAILQFILRGLETDLRVFLDSGNQNVPLWADEPLRLLGSLTRPDLLWELRAEAGGPLENAITEIACGRLHSNSRVRDHILESARRVLILMAGEGISRLLLRELSSEHHWVRHSGLKWAFVRNDPNIVASLTAIAERPLLVQADGTTESDASSEHCNSMIALAGLGADSAIVAALQANAAAVVPLALAELRAHQGTMPSSLTDDALTVLTSRDSTEDAVLQALVVVWCSADTTAIPVVRSALKRVPPDSEQALYAARTLTALGDDSQEFLELLVRLLPTKKSGDVALRLLPQFGEQGLNELAQWLRSAGSASDRQSTTFAIRALFDHIKTRDLAISEAAKRSARGRLFSSALYEIAGEASDPAIKEHILDKAFVSHSFDLKEPLHAIKGLAKFDVIRAIDAVQLGLFNHHKIENDLCRLLVEIAPSDASRMLVRIATHIDRESLHSAVGRALRRLGADIAATPVIEAMRGSVLGRKAAARVAAWLPSQAVASALDNLVTTDDANEVRSAALSALKVHRQEDYVIELMASFASASAECRWGLLLAILKGADAYLLADASDRLWIGHAITSSVPHIYWHFVSEELSPRLNAL